MSDIPEVINYAELMSREGNTMVQKGMNFGIKKSYSILLMSTEKNAPYNDEMSKDGEIVYEGHDAPKSTNYDKKSQNQPYYTKSGNLTENGKFYEAALQFKLGKREAAKVKIYRKIKPGIWIDMGFYDLVDGYKTSDGKREVFKFILKPDYEVFNGENSENIDIVHNRQIPGAIQREVYIRDKGKCVKCGSNENLHFDHILPFSKGGSSKTASNIQLLCAKHNLSKGNKFV